MSSIEVGSLADWVSGLASVFAAGTALYFWFRERSDSQRDKLTDISLWVEQDFPPTQGWKIVSINNSHSPVWKWAAILTWNIDNEEVTELVDADTAGLLPPGRNEFSWTPSASPPSEVSIDVQFLFEDIHGNCWTRSLGKSIRKANGFDDYLKRMQANKA